MLVKQKGNGSSNLPAFSNLLENFFGSDISNFFGSDVSGNIPAVNISESNESFKIDVAAPGMSKDDFKVNIENNVLMISSEKEMQREQKEGERFTRREFSYTSFNRSFTLPETVDAEKINAKYENGILCINIPKKEVAMKKPAKQIKVS